jgi:hypothetical protein
MDEQGDEDEKDEMDRSLVEVHGTWPQRLRDPRNSFGVEVGAANTARHQRQATRQLTP